MINAPSSQRSTGDARQSYTFGQVLERAEILAEWIRDRDMGLGSRVAIGGGNCIEQVDHPHVSRIWADVLQMGCLIHRYTSDRRGGRLPQCLAVSTSSSLFMPQGLTY